MQQLDLEIAVCARDLAVASATDSFGALSIHYEPILELVRWTTELVVML